MSRIPKLDRRRWYLDNLERLGWVNFEKTDNSSHSIREIHKEILKHFRDGSITHTTVDRDVKELRAEWEGRVPTPEEVQDAERLLLPENFPEFRKKLRGEHYETPPFQHALFYFLWCLARKKPVPQWVITLLDDLDPAHPFPEDLNELIVNQKILLSFLFLLAPRHGKTDLLQDYVLHTHASDPNIKILFGNGTVKKTEQFVGNYFLPVLEQHEWMIENYGPFEQDKPWSKTGYILAKREGFHKSNSLQPFGISGSVLSLDSDLILGDDLSDLRRASSETTTDGDYDWITTQLMTRREPHTAFAYVGSHVAVETGDLFERLEQKADELNIGDHRLIIKKIPAHNYANCDPVNDPEHEKCVMWPTMRPYSFLEAMRGLMSDDAMFEAVYNQIPRQRRMMHFPGDTMRSPYIHIESEEIPLPPPNRKDHEHIGVLDYKRSWRELPIYCCNREIAVGLGMDLATSERSGSSFTAITVGGACTICGRRYFVDYGQERMSPELHPSFLEQFLLPYPQIEVVVIEINQYQKALARDPRVEALAEKYGFYIKEWNTDERKHSAEFGIPQFGRHAKSGMLSVPFRTIADQEFAETLIKTFIRWPQKPNDLVMSGWLLDLGLMEIIEDSRHIAAEMMPGTEGYHTPFHDEQTFEVDLGSAFSVDWDYA